MAQTDAMNVRVHRPRSFRSTEPKTSKGAALWIGFLVLFAALEVWGVDEYSEAPRAVPAAVRAVVFCGMCAFLVGRARVLAKSWPASLMALMLLLIMCGFARAADDMALTSVEFGRLGRILYPPVVFLSAFAVGVHRGFSGSRVAIVGICVLLLVGSKMGILWRQGELRTRYVDATSAYSTTRYNENIAYDIIASVPLLLLGARGRVRPVVAASLIACVLFALVAGKRGAILAVTGSILVYVTLQMRNEWPRRIRAVALGVAIAVVGGIFVAKHSASVVSDWRDVEDPDRIGSGRGIIYRALLDGWLHASPVEKLIGRGLWSETKVTHSILGTFTQAHSDPVRVLTEFGVLGLFVLLLLWLELLKVVVQGLRLESEIAHAVGAAVAMVVLIGLYSMSLSGYTAALWWLAIGLGVGEIQGARVLMREPLRVRPVQAGSQADLRERGRRAPITADKSDRTNRTGMVAGDVIAREA